MENWSVDSAVRKVLGCLQANILKGHGREHTHKVNPRGESPLHIAIGFGAKTSVRQERGRIMARRGITYGERTFKPGLNDFTDEPRSKSPDRRLPTLAYSS